MKAWFYLSGLFIFVIIVSGIDSMTPGLKIVAVTGVSILVFIKYFQEQKKKESQIIELNDDLAGEKLVSLQRMHVDVPREHIMSEQIYGHGYHHSLGVPKPEYAGEVQQQLLQKDTEPSAKEILLHLFIPDFYEILIFVISIALTYLIFVPLFKIPLNEYSILVAYSGIMMVLLYFTRWGYSSVFHLLHEQEKALEKLMELDQGKENPYVLNFKIIGILVSMIFVTVGFMLN